MVEEKKDELEETILIERQSLELEAEDSELITAINAAIKESVPLKEKIDKIGYDNEKYWAVGTDLEQSDEVHPRRAWITDNRIFMAVETILSVVTARTPEPMIGGDVDNKVRENLIKALTIAYDVKLKVKQKLQRIVRHWFLYRIGVWKYRWDEGFILETVRPDKIGIDPLATSKQDCEFVYELLEDTVGNLIDKFPKQKEAIIEKYGKDKMKAKVKYYEFWGGNGEWVAWKLGGILLDKSKNPNFDYGSQAKGEEGDEDYEEATKGTGNLFKAPEFPYLFLNVLNLGKTMYDDTSLIEQAKTLQDSIKKRKEQISDLTEENKKLIIGSSNALSKDQLQKFVNEFGMVGLWLDKGNINDVKVESGTVDASMFNDMTHSAAEIDNLMGTHQETRGEGARSETLGGRKLLVAADHGRIDVIIENVEQLMEDFYNAYLHMLKVYGLEDAEFSDGEETIKLEEIPEGIMVIVKKGSTLPVDKASRAEMAMGLAKAEMIDPGTLLEDMGYGDVEERIQRLYEWLQMRGQIQAQNEGQVNQGTPEQKRAVGQIKKVMSSPQFQQAPPEQQQQMIAQAKEMLERIKQGGKQAPKKK